MTHFPTAPESSVLAPKQTISCLFFFLQLFLRLLTSPLISVVSLTVEFLLFHFNQHLSELQPRLFKNFFLKYDDATSGFNNALDTS